MPDVTGRFKEYSCAKGTFIYEFDCSRCHDTFLEPCPTVSAPALCHSCYQGRKAKGRTRGDNLIRVPAVHRRAKHKPQE